MRLQLQRCSSWFNFSQIFGPENAFRRVDLGFSRTFPDETHPEKFRVERVVCVKIFIFVAFIIVLLAVSVIVRCFFANHK